MDLLVISQETAEPIASAREVHCETLMRMIHTVAKFFDRCDGGNTRCVMFCGERVTVKQVTATFTPLTALLLLLLQLRH